MGYSYLNGELSASRFFDPSIAQGLWVAGDYQNEHWWPYVRIPSINDGPSAMAGTTHQMVRLVVLIATKHMVDVASSNEMLGRLSRAATGPDQPWAARAGVLKAGCITHNKMGLGPLKSGQEVRSEVSVLNSPGAPGRTYVVAWHNLVGLNAIGLGDVATLIKDTFEEYGQ